MKTLCIIRHSKSSWKDIALDDFDRPLTQKGKDDALFMAKKLSDMDISPNIIISSPSKRAESTVNIMKTQWQYDKEIVYNKKIYDSNMINLKNIIKNLNSNFETAFLVGHNPGLNMLAEDLCDFLKNIATTGIVIINFDCDKWDEISNQNSKFIKYIYPKKYK